MDEEGAEGLEDEVGQPDEEMGLQGGEWLEGFSSDEKSIIDKHEDEGHCDTGGGIFAMGLDTERYPNQGETQGSEGEGKFFVQLNFYGEQVGIREAGKFEGI